MAGLITTLVAGDFDVTPSNPQPIASATYTAGRNYILVTRNRRTAALPVAPSISGTTFAWTSIFGTYWNSNDDYFSCWIGRCEATETVALNLSYDDVQANISWWVGEMTGLVRNLVNLLAQPVEQLLDSTSTTPSITYDLAFKRSDNVAFAIASYSAVGTGQDIEGDTNMNELADVESSGLNVGYMHVAWKASEEATVTWSKSNSVVSAHAIFEFWLEEPPQGVQVDEDTSRRRSRPRLILDEAYNTVRNLVVAPADPLPQGTYVGVDLERLLKRPPPTHYDPANVLPTLREPIHAWNIDGRPIPRRAPVLPREGASINVSLTVLQEIMPFATFSTTESWPVPTPLRRPYRDAEGGFNDLVLTVLQEILSPGLHGALTDHNRRVYPMRIDRLDIRPLVVQTLVPPPLPPGKREPGVVAFPSRKRFVQPRDKVNLLPLALALLVAKTGYWPDVRQFAVAVADPDRSSDIRPYGVSVRAYENDVRPYRGPL